MRVLILPEGYDESYLAHVDLIGCPNEDWQVLTLTQLHHFRVHGDSDKEQRLSFSDGSTYTYQLPPGRYTIIKAFDKVP